MTPAPSLWPAAVQTAVFGLKLRIADPVWLWVAPLALLAGAWAAAAAIRRAARAGAHLPAERRARLFPFLGGSQGAAVIHRVCASAIFRSTNFGPRLPKSAAR